MRVWIGQASAPDKIAAIHVMSRVVRRCFLMGTDELTGKNYDHRKSWFENELKHLPASFTIDLLAFAILSNHFHLHPTIAVGCGKFGMIPKSLGAG